MELTPFTEGLKSKKINPHDQFYTHPDIAKKCIERLVAKIPMLSSRDTVTDFSTITQVMTEKNMQFLEPSAGQGAFSGQLPRCISVDIDPKSAVTIKGDFLTLGAEALGLVSSKQVIVIGNPPFGKNSSLAVKFFNHAANLADTIAFIVPKTFKKQSLQNRLHLNFHLIDEWDLPPKSFIWENQEYSVPSVFQIWQRKNESRKIEKYMENPWFDFVKKTEAQAAIRRVGGRSGRAFLDYQDAAEVSHYFIRTKEVPVEKLVDWINSIDFSMIVNSTAGVRSLSKYELTLILHQKQEELKS